LGQGDLAVTDPSVERFPWEERIRLRRLAVAAADGGFASREGVRGVSASITAKRVPLVSSGHAAAWVAAGGIH
jgi:hypothetical protein